MQILLSWVSGLIFVIKCLIICPVATRRVQIFYRLKSKLFVKSDSYFQNARRFEIDFLKTQFASLFDHSGKCFFAETFAAKIFGEIHFSEFNRFFINRIKSNCAKYISLCVFYNFKKSAPFYVICSISEKSVSMPSIPVLNRIRAKHRKPDFCTFSQSAFVAERTKISFFIYFKNKPSNLFRR